MSAAALVAAFEACTLPKERFNHAAHLTVALVYLRAHPPAEAAARMRAGLRRYLAAIGLPAGAYDETLTLAWLEVIAAFLAASDPTLTDDALAAALVDGCRRGDVSLRRDARERRSSPEAGPPSDQPPIADPSPERSPQPPAPPQATGPEPRPRTPDRPPRPPRAPAWGPGGSQAVRDRAWELRGRG